VPIPCEIDLGGHKNVIHTFRLKGKKLASEHFYFEVLCKKGKVYDYNKELLITTMERFNNLYAG